MAQTYTVSGTPEHLTKVYDKKKRKKAQMQALKAMS